VKRAGEEFEIRIKDMDMERRNGQHKTQGGGRDKEKTATITMGGSRRIKLYEMVGERIDDDSSRESRVESHAKSRGSRVVF